MTTTEQPVPTLIVDFANPHGATLRAGPFERLCFEGETLVSQTGSVLARHVDQKWILIAGGAYSRIDCSMRVKVRFRANKFLESRGLGPFDSFSSIDGVIYGEGRILAFCDRQLQDWYSYDLGSHWKAVIIEPA